MAIGFENCVVLMLFIWLTTTIHTSSTVKADRSSGVSEYCMEDEFVARCESDEIIMIDKAQYGRLNHGNRCLQNSDHLGCRARGVKSRLHGHCSGMRECRVRVFDAKFYNLPSECLPDMAGYLEASYQCIAVSGTSSRQQDECRRSREILLIAPSGRLASISAEQNGLGTALCPWHIRALPGQRITLQAQYFRTLSELPNSGSVVDSIGGAYNSMMTSSVCTAELLSITDGGMKKKMTACDIQQTDNADEVRWTGIHISTTSEVIVQLAGETQLKMFGRFIIQYKVEGCREMIAPYNSVIHHVTHDTLHVSCNRTELRWTFTCRNSTWVMHPHQTAVNCNTSQTTQPWTLRHMFDSKAFPYGILVVVALGVALGVFCGGLLLVCVVVYTKRRRPEALDGYQCESEIIRGSDQTLDEHTHDQTTCRHMTPFHTLPRDHCLTLSLDTKLNHTLPAHDQLYWQKQSLAEPETDVKSMQQQKIMHGFRSDDWSGGTMPYYEIQERCLPPPSRVIMDSSFEASSSAPDTFTSLQGITQQRYNAPCDAQPCDCMNKSQIYEAPHPCM